MVYLFISWLLINSVHGYGIYENRKKPFHTISENLASIPSLLLIYRIAHVINGLLLFLIVSIAVDSSAHWSILVLTAASILFEWAQAAVPYLNKWNKHGRFGLEFICSLRSIRRKGIDCLVCGKYSFAIICIRKTSAAP